MGIDFGIHAINRYCEERVQGWDIDSSMRIATDQLLYCWREVLMHYLAPGCTKTYDRQYSSVFFIVTGTTVFGFGSNIISDLQPTR